MSTETLFEVTYYCGERKKHFKRKVLVDDDLAIKRKLSGAILATITMKDPTAPDGKRKSLLMRKADGHFVATSGAPSSVPEYLFGPEYNRAQRYDTTNLWDLRKSAFRPLKKAA